VKVSPKTKASASTDPRNLSFEAEAKAKVSPTSKAAASTDPKKVTPEAKAKAKVSPKAKAQAEGKASLSKRLLDSPLQVQGSDTEACNYISPGGVFCGLSP
jgi:hypothetical protein